MFRYRIIIIIYIYISLNFFFYSMPMVLLWMDGCARGKVSDAEQSRHRAAVCHCCRCAGAGNLHSVVNWMRSRCSIICWLAELCIRHVCNSVELLRRWWSVRLVHATTIWLTIRSLQPFRPPPFDWQSQLSFWSAPISELTIHHLITSSFLVSLSLVQTWNWMPPHSQS